MAPPGRIGGGLKGLSVHLPTTLSLSLTALSPHEQEEVAEPIDPALEAAEREQLIADKRREKLEYKVKRESGAASSIPCRDTERHTHRERGRS